MKILFVCENRFAWKSGIWLHRVQIPAESLDKRGHGVQQIALQSKAEDIPEHIIKEPHTVIFGRVYPDAVNPVEAMVRFQKAGARVLYDMDDDFWQVAKDNPSVLVSNAQKDQYEALIKQADAIITPSKALARKFKRLIGGKEVFICPNGTNGLYKERPHEHDKLIIGYMGAASHWKDLQLIGDVLVELNKKYDFMFTLYGITGEPLEAAMYYYNRSIHEGIHPEKDAYSREALKFYNTIQKLPMYHWPFMPPELHPQTLARMDFDIGLAPLEDTEFNHGKSCVKFYEYASVGTPTLASKVEPYKSEVNYCAKNTFKDWYNKLEKLIVDKKFREKILKEQQEYVKKNNSLEAMGLKWELAAQRPSKIGAPTVLNQQEL